MGESVLYCSSVADIPLAYLVTFRCYGTWLHGDERGAIDRRRNQYSSPYIPPNPNWHSYNVRQLKQSPVTLSPLQRRSVERAVHETCKFRDWELLALNVRTNHVHALVHTGTLAPERVLNALKANATRQMRQDGHWPHEHSPWADRGSRRYIWTEVGIERATEYVVNDQDGEMPEFDPPRLKSHSQPDSPIRYRGRY